jgi:uncharacterized protein YndB with AHSA1/START domain
MTTTPPAEVLLTKELDAPRELVFEAFSRAEHVEKWIAPDGFTAKCVVEFHRGGTFSIRMIGHGMDHTATGAYQEIIPPEKIVWTMGFEDVPGHEMVTTVTFAERGSGTTVTVRQVFPRWDALTPAQQALMAPRMGGAKEGWTQSLRHLAEHLKR